jgi:hypothetical protein
MSRLLNCSMGFAAVVAGAAVQAQTSSAEDFTSAVKIQGAITQNASGNNVKQDLNVGSAQKSRATSFKADVTTGNITQTGKNGARQTINVGGMNNSKADRFDARVTTGNIEQVANRGERQELDIGSVSNSTVAGTARTRVSVGNVKQTGEGDIALGALKNANVQQFQSNLSIKGKIEGNNIRMGSVIGQERSTGRSPLSEPTAADNIPRRSSLSMPKVGTASASDSKQRPQTALPPASSILPFSSGTPPSPVSASPLAKQDPLPAAPMNSSPAGKHNQPANWSYESPSRSSEVTNGLWGYDESRPQGSRLTNNASSSFKPIDSATITVDGKVIELQAFPNVDEHGNYDKDGAFQCTALVSQYLAQLGFTNAPKAIPNGKDVVTAITTGPNKEYFAQIDKTIPPSVGSIVSMDAGTGGVPDGIGHVAIVKSVANTSEDKMVVNLIEQNIRSYGTNEFAVNRTIEFSRSSDGVWSATHSLTKGGASYNVLNWTTPITLPNS